MTSFVIGPTRYLYCAFLAIACCWSVCAGLLRAQEPDEAHLRSEALGRITGHVYCGDINVPARLASVTIQSISSLRKSDQAETGSPSESALPVSIRTDLDGRFTVNNVKPGKYVVVAWLPGYLSPLASLATKTDKFGGPADGFSRGLEQLVPTVIVESNQTSSVDIELERGAEISGTIDYDDGGPVVGAEVQLLQQIQHEQWRLVPLSNSLVTFKNGNTDDRGNFRLVGVPPGQYIVSATLPLQTFWGAAIDRGSVQYAMPRTLDGKLEVYSGNTFRRNAATPIKVSPGENRPGTDITIPLSKLHHIAGVLTAASEGHVLRSGLVELLYADDMSTVQRVRADDDGTFLINFVPNGDYLLKVQGGALDNDGDMKTQSPASQSRNKLYKSLEIPVTVQGDINNLVITLSQ
jgi:hypothetical protein